LFENLENPDGEKTFVSEFVTEKQVFIIFYKVCKFRGTWSCCLVAFTLLRYFMKVFIA